MSKPFIVIDEQGWCCHFRTEQRFFYRPACWLLSLLRKSKLIDVVNTYGISDGEKIHSLDEERRNKIFESK